MNAQIVLENISVRLPNRVLFEDINWTLYEGTRVALAGRNGSGKSTLLKIMAGHAEATSGKRTVVGARQLRVGFLDQSSLERAAGEAMRLQEKSVSPLLLIQSLLEQTRSEDDYTDTEWEIRKILSGLGFEKEMMEGPIHRLSGGWLLRVFIAEALLKKPEVLLLDEPTNHLDLSSIQWLEEFLLEEYRGSLVLVTHDVALQKRTTDSLAVIHGGRFFFQKHQRDYLTFRQSLEEQKVNLRKNIEGLEKKIEENMEFVHKFRAKAQTAARAQSKLKMAEDLEAEKRELEDRLARIEGHSYNLKFRFRSTAEGSKFPLSLKSVSFSYKQDSPLIVKNVSLDVKRGQRVAILGDNGAGKTTLLNLIAARLQPRSGEVQYGHNVLLGYFGQHQLEELSLEDTVLDNLKARAEGISLEELRGWLGAFGFGGDDVTKKARVLSGGEKARLALLRILVARANVCLLDEPTNHLDIETKELLTNAIKEFEGTVLFVSHDREFVEAIADRILYITTAHELTDHVGDLNSFFDKYPRFVRHLEEKEGGSKRESRESQTAESQLSYDERKRVKNQVKSLEKKISDAETAIDQYGQEKEKLHGLTDSQAFYAMTPEEQKAIFDRLAQIDSDLHQKMIDWEKWSLELEKLKKLIG